MDLARSLARAAFLVVAHGAVAAAQIDAGLRDYTVASWSIRDGLPSNFVAALAEDAEGYLWVGTTGGLVRFDGLHFTTVEALGPARVTALLVPRDGGLWVGHGQGRGISRLQRGDMRRYSAGDGIAGTTVNALVEDTHGTIWAGTEVGLFRFADGQWIRVGAGEGFPDTPVQSARVSRSGDLIVGTGAGLFRRAADRTRFEKLDTFADYGRGVLDIAEDSGGRLWVVDNETGFRPLGRPWPPAAFAIQAKGNRVLFDRQGNLWVGTTAALLRVPSSTHTPPPTIVRTEIFGGRFLLEDRDGNLWIGTVEGLFRLSPRRVTAVMDVGVVSGVEAASDGAVWVGSSEGLFRYRELGEPVEHRLFPGRRVTGLHIDRNGSVWLRTDAGLLRLPAAGAVSPLTLQGIPTDDIDAVLPIDERLVWVSSRTRGLLAWRDGRVEQIPGLGSARVTLLYADTRGRLWLLAGRDRLLAHHADGRLQSFGLPAGLGAAPYRAVYEDSRGVIWVGGSEGVSRLIGDRFVPLRQANVSLAVSAIVEDADGDLWLGSSEGIAVVPRAELEEAERNESYAVRLGIFDASDGLAGVSMLAAVGSGNAARAVDGRLWFLTGRGLSVVNPRTLKGRANPVALRIDNISVDDRRLETNRSPVALPHGTERMQIDYGAIELSSPQKVRYRYLLEGFDAQWIDAGVRRTAVYQHLPPREYQFRVVATNLEDPWNQAEAVWAFSVSPPVYQTPSFVGLALLAVLAVTWGAWRLRLRRHRRQFSLLLAERVRLSRELHDTLLQSLVGMTLQFEAVAGRLEPTSPVRRQMVALRRQMEDFIREAREAIWNLRLPAAQPMDLAAALQESCERTVDTAATRALQLRFAVQGTPRRASPDVERQLLRIGQESVLNAVRHARATEVRVELIYSPETVVLRVADDGCGFDVAHAARVRNGHLGLVTMQERAKEVGGELRVDSSVGGGTRLEVAMPMTSARATAAMS